MLIPQPNQPADTCYIVSGIIRQMQYTEGGVLQIQMEPQWANYAISSDVFSINLSNKYDYHRFVTCIGDFCWENGNLRLDRLVNKTVLLAYHERSSYNSYGNPERFVNFHDLVIIDELKKVSA